MRRSFPVGLLCMGLLSCQSPRGEWRAKGEVLPNTSYRAVVSGLGAQLVLTTAAEDLVRQWRESPTSAAMSTPTSATPSSVARGQMLNAFVVFGGCAPDASGRCDVMVDYLLIDPRGEVEARRADLVLWRDVAPPAGMLQLAPASLAMRMDASDPSGEYLVRALIHDRHQNVRMTLERSFVLEE
jgi:hypothetical protein